MSEFRVLAIRDLASAAQLHEHVLRVLRQFLGIGAPAGEAQREAEYARFVLAHQLVEGGEVAGTRALEVVPSGGGFRRPIGHQHAGVSHIHMLPTTPADCPRGAAADAGEIICRAG